MPIFGSPSDTASRVTLVRQGGRWLSSEPNNEVEAADAFHCIGTARAARRQGQLVAAQLRCSNADQEPDGPPDALIETGERRRELKAAWVAGEGVARPSQAEG